MIHDKDYIMRIVRQFSTFLANKLLGKNEGRPEEELLVFETQMKDIFKMSYDELSAKNSAELRQWVETHQEPHQLPYYELLGHLFYYKYKEPVPSREPAINALVFYELWTQKSSVFSMVVMQRIAELKEFTLKENEEGS